MSVAGVIEETVVEKEIEEPTFIPSMIRRLSAIDTLVTEARVFARRNSIQSNSSGDTIPDLELRNRRHSLAMDSLPPLPQAEEYRRKRRQTLHKIEPISENINEETSKF